MFPGWGVGAETKELNELLFASARVRATPTGCVPRRFRTSHGRGDVERAALYLDYGADLHARDEEICSTPLGWAAKYGQRPMVELLLTQGAGRIFRTIPRGRRRRSPGPFAGGIRRSPTC